MKKAVLFVLPTAGAGGAERVTISLLRQLDPARYDLSLLLLSREGQYLSSVPGHVRVLDLGGARARSALLPLVRTIRRNRPDIVFSTHGYINILCLLASYFVGPGVTFFTRQPILPQPTAAGDGMPKVYKSALRHLYPRAERIIAQNHAMRDAMVDVFGLSADKIDVLINPVDRELIDSMVDGKRNPFDPARTHFVAAGRLVRQKGFDVLLGAFRIVHEKEPDARLHILGEGDERAKLENLIRDYGLTNVVNLTGFKANPYPYFRFADLFVLSSRFEGLPNAVLESLHLGTACVATRCIPFMSEIIQEPHNGALVDVEDAAALADKLLHRNAYRLAPELLERVGTLNVEKLFSERR